jgi:hypothetical protein
MENFKKFVKAEGEKKLEIKDYLYAFGKHKGKTFEWVYDNDLGYVSWLLENIDEDKNKHLYSYYSGRIEEDFCDSNLQKTKQKLDLKETDV